MPSVIDNDAGTEAPFVRDERGSANYLAAIVIPASLDLRDRLPNKPLLAATGKPLILYPLQEAFASDNAVDVGLSGEPTVVKVCRKHHPSKLLIAQTHSGTKAIFGSDRLRPWMDKFDGWDTYDIVVTVGCSEAMLAAKDIDNLILACHASGEICTLTAKLPPAMRRNTAVVKMAVADGGAAVWFGREVAKAGFHNRHEIKMHVGAYAIPARHFKAVFDAEKHDRRAVEVGLEQLTWLRQSLKIRAVDLKHSDFYFPIKTVEQYEQFVRFQTKLNAKLKGREAP